MSEKDEPQMTRDDAGIHLGFTSLREDLQELRQDMRELTRETSRRFDDLGHRMDQRFSRRSATLLALGAAIIAAVKL